MLLPRLDHVNRYPRSVLLHRSVKRMTIIDPLRHRAPPRERYFAG